MRIVWAVVALIALIAGATGIRASVTLGVSAPPVQAKRFGSTFQLVQAKKPLTKFNWKATSGNPSVAPFKWAGLLQIPTLKDPKIFVQCTAQFITDNVVLTAGHCLQDPATPNGPFPDPAAGTFTLQFQNGDGSKTFKIVCGATNPLWTQQLAGWNGVEHDYAMLLVDGTSPTGHISYALDWKSNYQYAFRIGYPQDILSGSFIEFAPGIVFFGDELPFAVTTKIGGPPELPNAVVQWGPITDATHGMSGGAWIVNMSDDEAAGKNVLIAVTSSGPQEPDSQIPIYPGGTWAAYLRAAEFNPLLQFVSNGCK